jgi:hypothetical protein
MLCLTDHNLRGSQFYVPRIRAAQGYDGTVEWIVVQKRDVVNWRRVLNSDRAQQSGCGSVIPPLPGLGLPPSYSLLNALGQGVFGYV